MTRAAAKAFSASACRSIARGQRQGGRRQYDARRARHLRSAFRNNPRRSCQTDARSAVAAEPLGPRQRSTAFRTSHRGVVRNDRAWRGSGLQLGADGQKCFGERVCGLVAVPGVFRQCAERDHRQRRGDVAIRSKLTRIRSRDRQVHQHHLRGRFGFKRQPACQQLEQDHADCVQVASRVDRVAAPLLRRHVVGGAANDSDTGDRWPVFFGQEFR